jgi:hypothetical protein
MPIIEAFAFLAEAGGAEFGTAAAFDAATAAEAAGAAGALGTGLADYAGMGAGLADYAGMGAMGGAGAGAGAGAGITQASMGADVLGGGAGAGGAGVNAAQVGAQQAQAAQVANSGIAAPPPAAPASSYALNAPSVAPGAPGMQYGLSAPQTGLMNGAGMEGAGSGLTTGGEGLKAGVNSLYQGYQPSALETGFDKFSKFAEKNPFLTSMVGLNIAQRTGLLNSLLGGGGGGQQSFNAAPYNGPLSKYHLSPDFKGNTANPADFQYTPRRYAQGGILQAASGGPVEQMSNNAAIGANTHYLMSNMSTSAFATPYQTPIQSNVIAPTGGATVNQSTGELNPQGTRFAEGGVTGSGGINLNIPLDIGGGGGGGGGTSQPSDFFGGGGQGGGDLFNGVPGQYRGYPNSTNAGLGGLFGGLQAQPQEPQAQGDGGQIGQSSLVQLLQRMKDQGQQQQQNANVTPQVRFAQGGVAHFSEGNLASSLDYYDTMMEGPAKQQIAEAHRPHPGSHDVGIIRDTDPDTMYLDPVSAAQVRMAKINKRANMQTPSMKRPTPMGQLNLKPQGGKAEAAGSTLDPENAAQGGIMQASGHLGGYATGGQPRLLKGPGDGMSDDIPATIADKQPARLADGEFVVPADVVSHLGNGSTEAGAKKLHGMMNNVRKARTGRQSQGKQINPDKYLPR